MKNKIKQLTKIGILLFGISVLFISCEKDDTETLHSNRENPNVSAFKITTVTNKEVQQNDNLNIELEKIRLQIDSDKSNALNRTVYSTEYDFSIDTENVTYIENFDASYHSYTFPIFRTSPNELIENLLLSLQEDGSYKAFIVTYNLTEQEQESIANNHQIDLTDKASFTEINSDNLTSDILSRTVPCGYSSEWTCWEEACPIDGCWDPQYTTTHCNSVLVYNDDCDLEIGGGSGNTDGSNSNGGGSTGNTNTNHNDNDNDNDNTTNNTNVTSPNIPTISDQIENCINGPTLIGDTDNTTIDTEILDQINLTRTEWGTMNNNLQNNNCSEEAQQQAIEELLEEFDEQIFLDDDFKNNDCLKSVYDAMGKASTFNNYLKNFEAEFSVAHLRFSSSSSLASSTNAETSPPNNYLITITFNENNLDRPSLSVARTMIHEMIHAEIFRKLLSAANQPNLNYSQYTDEEWRNFIINLRNNFEGIYDYYLRWRWNVPAGQTPSDAQHEAMAQHYRDIIKQTLMEYDANQTDATYEALAWTGLMGSGTFDSTTGLYSNSTIAWSNLSQQERLNIITTINTFNSSNPNCQN